MRDQHKATHKIVATWITTKDFELLKQLAQTNKVGLAAYVRAIIIDALQDECCSTNYRISTIQSNRESSLNK